MKTLRKKIENCLWYDEDNDQTEFVVDNIEKLIIKEKKKLIKEIEKIGPVSFPTLITGMNLINREQVLDILNK